VAKKRTASRKKPARAKAPKAAKGKKGATKRVKSAADSSRLDTSPLQDHIRKRIKELEDQYSSRTAAAGREDDTLNRLKVALETLQDICEPTMTIPI
jgi:hypothetical protein